jgi:hypothetical protein
MEFPDTSTAHLTVLYIMHTDRRVLIALQYILDMARAKFN